MDDKEATTLERRMGHLERSLMAHSQALALQSQSLEHLIEKMDARFDNIELAMHDRGETLKWAAGIAMSIVVTFGVAVYYMLLEPMSERLWRHEDRLLAVELELERRSAYVQDHNLKLGTPPVTKRLLAADRDGDGSPDSR